MCNFLTSYRCLTHAENVNNGYINSKLISLWQLEIHSVLELIQCGALLSLCIVFHPGRFNLFRTVIIYTLEINYWMKRKLYPCSDLKNLCPYVVYVSTNCKGSARVDYTVLNEGSVPTFYFYLRQVTLNS
jgi:hypothetical protein